MVKDGSAGWKQLVERSPAGVEHERDAAISLERIQAGSKRHQRLRALRDGVTRLPEQWTSRRTDSPGHAATKGSMAASGMSTRIVSHEPSASTGLIAAERRDQVRNGSVQGAREIVVEMSGDAGRLRRCRAMTWRASVPAHGSGLLKTRVTPTDPSVAVHRGSAPDQF